MPMGLLVPDAQAFRGRGGEKVGGGGGLECFCWSLGVFRGVGVVLEVVSELQGFSLF